MFSISALFFYPPKNTKPPKEKETKQKEKAEDERKLEIIITEIVHFFSVAFVC